jgi:low affinity Fe/Cu permease
MHVCVEWRPTRSIAHAQRETIAKRGTRIQLKSNEQIGIDMNAKEQMEDKRMRYEDEQDVRVRELKWTMSESAPIRPIESGGVRTRDGK